MTHGTKGGDENANVLVGGKAGQLQGLKDLDLAVVRQRDVPAAVDTPKADRLKGLKGMGSRGVGEGVAEARGRRVDGLTRWIAQVVAEDEGVARAQQDLRQARSRRREQSRAGPAIDDRNPVWIRAKAAYEEALPQALAALLALGELPVRVPAEAALGKAIGEARTKAAVGLYVEANEILEAADAKGQEKTGREVWAQVERRALESFPKSKQKADGISARLGNRAGTPLTASAAGEFQEQLRSLLGKMYGSAEQPILSDASLLDELASLDRAITVQSELTTRAIANANIRIAATEQTFGRKRSAMSATDEALCIQDIRDAELALADFDPERALLIVDEVDSGLGNIESAEAAITPPLDRQASTRSARLLIRLATFQGEWDGLDESSKKELSLPDFEPANWIAALQRSRAKLRGDLDEPLDLEEFNRHADQLEALLPDLEAKLEAQLGAKLEAKVEAPIELQFAASAIDLGVDDIADDDEGSVGTASSAEVDDDNLESIATQFRESKIEIGDGVPAQDQYAEALERAKTSVLNLSTLDPNAAGALERRIFYVESAIEPSAGAKRLKLYTMVLDAIEVSARQKSTDGVVPNVLEEQIRADLEAAAQSVRKLAGQEEHAAMVENIASWMRSTRALLDTHAVGALLEAKRTSLVVKAEAALAVEIANGDETTLREFGSMEALSKDLDEYRWRLRPGGFIQKYLPEEHSSLSAKFEALSKTIAGMTPSARRADIRELDAAIVKAANAAADADKAWAKLRPEIDALERKVSKLGTGRYPNLQVDAILRLQQLRELGKNGGKVELARTRLASLATDIARCATSSDEAGGIEEAALGRVVRRQQEAAAWKAQYEIFDRLRKKTAHMLTSNGYGLYKMGKAAAATFEETGDYDLALSQLRAARARLDYLRKYPEGMESSKRMSLPRVNRKWKAAVGKLRLAFDEVAVAVAARLGLLADSIGDGVRQEVEKAVRSNVTRAKARFDATLFDAAVEVLTRDDVALDTKRAERSRILGELGLLLAAFEHDPLVRDLVDNPFYPGVRAEVVNARLAVLDMQQNLLGCL